MRIKFTRATALSLLLLLVLGSAPVRVHGDEGMFLPDAITQMLAAQLKKRGLLIPTSELYNPSGVSIKDAVVIVGGGTGEFVSPDGLLLTNHHVSFEALVSASDPSKDYGTNGYTARSRAEELRAKDYTVTITQDLKEVTAEVTSGINEATPSPERSAAIQSKIRAMEGAGSRPADGIQVHVLPMNEGLSYYQFTYLVLRDVRIVYAPPKSIGFFGGDPDNFEWPRHCGDFAFMRVYVGPDGKPADFSPNNVPYRPKKFLSLSTAGVKEGDFMMVMGYPGSTRRYRESYSVAYNQDIAIPFSIDIFSYQVETLKDAGKNDPALRVKLQSTIFSLSNELKNLEGSVMAMRRANIVATKRNEEAAFTRWVNADPARKAKYGEVLPTLEKAYQLLTATAQHDLLVQQMFSASDLVAIASFAQRTAADKEKPEAERNPGLGPQGIQRVRAQLAGVLAERNPTAERELLAYLLTKADELPPTQKIDFVEKRFGKLQGEARRRAEEDFAREIGDSKRYSTFETVSSLFDLSTAQLRELREPLVDFAVELSLELQRVIPRQQTFNATVSRWRPLLLEGMTAMHGTKTYPDANRTLRFSYGEVKGYVPREAINYAPFTTLAGVVEKDTGREPFDVPEKLKQLFRAHDFGQYGGPARTNVPVDFLSNADIIGGNSGSPIMNGRGEQVGIIFDGNYEGLGNDFFYNDAKGRAIAVDIRYVLFLTDKFADAGYILKELDIRSRASRSR
ncbi:MAG: S46 family peptidase [Acidobacteriota bacterium]|nr:S46 family peptidase [Acidobacteriota bacterium]